MKILLYTSLLTSSFIISCAPCRQVKIDSYPPGAAISINTSSSYQSSRIIPLLESWTLLGYTPLAVSGCRLKDEIKAAWSGQEIFFPEYHGSKRIHFNFEKGGVEEE